MYCLKNVYPKEEVAIGEKALEVDHFTQHGLFEDVSFYARKGEIVGFAGLVGAGRTETMRNFVASLRTFFQSTLPSLFTGRRPRNRFSSTVSSGT